MERFKHEFDAQLAAPIASSDLFTVPLIIDFDEVSGAFLYDATLASKNPDWTYTPAPPPPEQRDGTIHKTKADALAREEHFDGKTTE